MLVSCLFNRIKTEMLKKRLWFYKGVMCWTISYPSAVTSWSLHWQRHDDDKHPGNYPARARNNHTYPPFLYELKKIEHVN